jgi:hypothetical protein
MRRIGYIVLAAVLVLVPLGSAHGQSQDDALRIEAVATPNPVGSQEMLAYTIRVQGANLADIDTPEPPLTSNLALQRPTPATERNVSFSDGKLTRSVTFRWTYEPVRTGSARIYPAKVVVRDDSYETAAIDIEVVAQSQRSQRPPSPAPNAANPPSRGGSEAPSSQSSGVSNRDLFIRAQPTTRQVYQNEQLIVTYRLYFRDGIQLRHSRLASAWDATGFWREELNVDSRPIPRTTAIDGRSYQTIVLKRAALFPTRSGSLNVEPLEIETEARAAPRYDPSAPFYTPSDRYQTESLASEALRIEATPLPNDAPPSFNGAVGSFRMRARIDSAEVQVGQPVRLRIQIEGAGNIATMQPPAIEPPDAFEVYDPKEQTSINRDGTRIRGTKTFTYVLVPQTSGMYTVPPITFSFFDPEQAQYRTMRATVDRVRVLGDAPAVAMGTTGSGLPVNDVAGIMTASSWTRVDARPLYARAWPYAAVVTPLLAWIGVLVVRRRASDTDPEAAGTAPAEHLASARHHQQNQNPEACYDAVERAVLHFIGERMRVAAAGLTRPQLDAALAQRDVPPRAREALFELLDVCDQARYSPARSSDHAMQSAIQRAEQLIDFFDTALS